MDTDEDWEYLYDRIESILERVGVEDAFHQGDYWVHDSYWGFPHVRVYIHDLRLLHPTIISMFRDLLTGFPDWEIIVVVAVPGSGETWPDMGLTIRKHEIIDGLQREYFPAEYRSIFYEGARPGTESD